MPLEPRFCTCEVLAFPAWPESRDATYFQEVLLHIQDCAAVCEYLGESFIQLPRTGLPSLGFHTDLVN